MLDLSKLRCICCPSIKIWGPSIWLVYLVLQQVWSEPGVPFCEFQPLLVVDLTHHSHFTHWRRILSTVLGSYESQIAIHVYSLIRHYNCNSLMVGSYLLIGLCIRYCLMSSSHIQIDTLNLLWAAIIGLNCQRITWLQQSVFVFFYGIQDNHHIPTSLRIWPG